MHLHIYVTTILFIVFEHINRILTQGIPISPCPKVFQYRFDGMEWFGIMSIRNPETDQPLHLKVTLSVRGKPTSSYLGEIQLLTRGLILSDAPVLYKVKFPITHFPPKLLQIVANNEIICLGSADLGMFVTQIKLEHTRKFTYINNEDIVATPSALPATIDDNINPAHIPFGTKHMPLATWDINPKRADKDMCGVIDERISFHMPNSDSSDDSSGAKFLQTRTHAGNEFGAIPIVSLPPVVSSDSEAFGGVMGATTSVNDLPSISRGAWPWLAAIYVNNLTSLAYQCGGTLVSTRIVISAAHCFQMFKKQYTANEVLVFLGRHNLKNWNEEHSLASPVDDIFVHPDYDLHLNTYDADLAVIVLKNDVRFNTFIRPACLWSGSTKTQYIDGERGIVVGWSLGFSNGTLLAAKATVPRIITAPIVSNDVCFQNDQHFRSISSNRTFCAGTVKRLKKLKSAASTVGPCRGDSGAGLMIFKNNKWMLRGTVSASLPRTGELAPDCSANQYVVYTDVAQFLDWIYAFLL